MKLRGSLPVLVVAALIMSLESGSLGEEMTDVSFSDHLVGRWKFGCAANASARNNSMRGFVFFSPDGMFVSSDAQNTVATCWEPVRKNNQIAIMLGRSPNNILFVNVISTNKVTITPMRKDDPQVSLERDGRFPKVSEDFNNLLGSWKVIRKENKSEDYALISFYPQMVFIQQIPSDISGGEWTLSSRMFDRQRKILSMGERKYAVTFSGTNLFHAIAQGKYDDLVFERRKPSELGYPRADTQKRQ
jgi:hypothetical protein